MSQLDIAVTIADHKGTAQIQIVFAGGAVQHSRLRLAARTGIVTLVRTIVQRVDMGSFFGELRCHQFVNGMDQRVRKISAANAGLIGDHDGRIFRFIQPPDGRGDKGKHTKTADVIQVTDFFGDGSVAIEEDGWAKGCGFSQKPPPQNATRRGPRLRLLRAARWSCNGGPSDSVAESMGCNTAFLAQPCTGE